MGDVVSGDTAQREEHNEMVTRALKEGKVDNWGQWEFSWRDWAKTEGPRPGVRMGGTLGEPCWLFWWEVIRVGQRASNEALALDDAEVALLLK